MFPGPHRITLTVTVILSPIGLGCSQEPTEQPRAAGNWNASPLVVGERDYLGRELCGMPSKRGKAPCARLKGSCPSPPVDEDGNPLEPLWGTIFECEYECGFESRKLQLVETHELTCEKRPRNGKPCKEDS